jgi:hypothetical protein
LPWFVGPEYTKVTSAYGTKGAVERAAKKLDTVVVVTVAEGPHDEESLQRAILSENRSLKEEVKKMEKDGVATKDLLTAQGDTLKVSVSGTTSN